MQLDNIRRIAESLLEWGVRGSPAPPPSVVKQATLLNYVIASGYRRFVETGTYLGETTRIIADLDLEIDTIELGANLYDRAVPLFADRPKVRLHLGDSTRLLPTILRDLPEPAVFWLDGHFSSGNTARGDKVTPIQEELLALEAHPVRDHIILVDDIRGFGGNDYPTVEWVREIGVRIVPGAQPLLANDSLIFATSEQHDRAAQVTDSVARVLSYCCAA